jgi:holo-[acyl-carrier protein] synthase
MIVGIGTDIVAIDRLARLLDRHGGKALEKLLAPAEQAEFRQRFASGGLPATPRQQAQAAQFLARRWAAKEALVKALGTGFSVPATASNIAVAHDAAGKPFFVFAPMLMGHIDARGAVAHLSISDEKTCATAVVVLECPVKEGAS